MKITKKIIDYFGLIDRENNKVYWRAVYFWVGFAIIISLFARSIPTWETDLWGVTSHYLDKTIIILLLFFAVYQYWGYLQLKDEVIKMKTSHKISYEKFSQETNEEKK